MNPSESSNATQLTQSPPTPDQKVPTGIPTQTPSKLAAALAKAQSKFVQPKKTRTVDYFDNKGKRVFYKYADLADLIESVRVPLSDNELAHYHHNTTVGGKFGMVTTLKHSSGEHISTWYPLIDPMTVRPQEFGSELTYARRYSLSCLLGIASEEDDDGNGHTATDDKQNPPAQKNAPKPSGAPSPLKPKSNAVPNIPTPEPKKPQLTETQFKDLSGAALEKGWTKDGVKQYIFEKWNLENILDLNLVQYKSLMTTIETGVG